MNAAVLGTMMTPAEHGIPHCKSAVFEAMNAQDVQVDSLYDIANTHYAAYVSTKKNRLSIKAQFDRKGDTGEAIGNAGRAR